MFRRGRPGRPLLAGALIVGASRSAARHEVGVQSQYAAESQRAAERSRLDEEQRVALAVERSRREDQERERRTALAIDEAIVRERSRGRSPMPAGVQDRGDGHQAPPGGAFFDPYSQGAPPAYMDNGMAVEGTDYMRVMGGRQCSSCGCARTWQDRYCAACGRKLASAVLNEQETVGVANTWMGSSTEAKMV